VVLHRSSTIFAIGPHKDEGEENDRRDDQKRNAVRYRQPLVLAISCILLAITGYGFLFRAEVIGLVFGDSTP
jgi:hypothetical protein